MVKPLLVLWLTNSALLYVATMVYPANYVLGNFWLPSWGAAIVAGLIMTVLMGLAKPVADKLNLKESGPLKAIAFYWLVDFAAIWITARLAFASGFGVSSYMWVAGLALVADFAQWGALKATKSM